MNKDGVVHASARIGIVAGALVAVALAVSGCASRPDEGGPDPALRGQWELQSGTDAQGTIPLANQLITLTIDGDSSTTGRSTCSDYRAHVYGSLATLWVTATLPKAEHCGIQAQQDIEQRYINDLNQVRTSTLSGGVLDLLAPGVDLRYQRALAVPLTLVVGHTWQLETVKADSYYATQNPLPFIERGATLKFSKKGSLTGATGCRSFSTTYRENAGEIVIGKLVNHEKHGCDSDQQAVDTYVMSVVQSGFTFTSGLGELGISSPRAEITLAFVD
ncbi:MAG TPA: META domain-containing protein [Galbitalea sp.]|nr:META domain-containing protein [Galbitalea sp.]